MIILAVIIGYILGIAPFVAPNIIEKIEATKKVKEEAEDSKEQEEIFNEWLNGVNEPKQVDQHELFEEYMTGKVKGA